MPYNNVNPPFYSLGEAEPENNIRVGDIDVELDHLPRSANKLLVVS